jgi:hypothetical protein
MAHEIYKGKYLTLFNSSILLIWYGDVEEVSK